MPGLASLDVTGVTDETARSLDVKKKELEATVLSFSEGVTLSPEAGAAVAKVAAQMDDLRRTALTQRSTLRVTVIGHASPEGPEQLNSSLAKNRADEIVRLLVANGIHPSILTPQGSVGTPSANVAAGTSPGRNVTFRVTILQGTATKTEP